MFNLIKLLFTICLCCIFTTQINSHLASYTTEKIVYVDFEGINNDYIRMHLPTAIRCSKTYGIPVSICLSQAIYESGYGNSDLAVKANNHFGMKKGRSTKETFSFIDDDRDSLGNLVKSKFRKYNNAEESFYDYGRMLSNSKRFAHLFKIPAANYSAWARGLLQSGYATNPEYALQLVRIIEKHQLYRLDRAPRAKQRCYEIVDISVGLGEVFL